MRRRFPLLPLVLAAAVALPAAAEIATYTAVYDVDYKRRNLGEATFRVAGAGENFVFESSVRARGLLRLARPNPAIERSRFDVVNGKLTPQRFEYEDGSRGGDDNFSAEFDRGAGRIVVTTQGGTRDYPLSGGALDRGTMQVALMRDLAAGRHAGPYTLADEDGLKTYSYMHAGAEQIDTGIGRVATEIYLQQREGSSRVTRLWVSPELDYLPVRIAQFREGEIYTDFVLESVDGLGR